MKKDQLSPEDRALHDAFFEAYRVKFNELNAGASEGAEVSLDACTVHAIRTAIADAFKAWAAAWSSQADELADELGELQDLEAMECPEDFVNAHGRVVFGRAAGVLRNLSGTLPVPRIVEAVGVGVRVKPPEAPGAGNVCKWVELPSLAAFNGMRRQWRTGCGQFTAAKADTPLPRICPICQGIVSE